MDRSPPSSSGLGADRDRERSTSPAASDSQAEFGSDSSPSAALSRKHNGTFMGMIRRTSQNVGASLATSVGSYLPTAVAEMWEPARDFAWCKIPKSATNTAGSSALGNTTSLRSVVAMSNNSPQVMVVTNEGHFYVFGIDLEKGGEGTLVKVYEVGGESDKLGQSTMEE